MTERLLPMSRIRAKNPTLDTVAYSKAHNSGRAFEILTEAQMYWNNMYLFRKDRERNKRYCYGDQWKDRIKVDGEWMTEEEYIKQQGNVPL